MSLPFSILAFGGVLGGRTNFVLTYTNCVLKTLRPVTSDLDTHVWACMSLARKTFLSLFILFVFVLYIL